MWMQILIFSVIGWVILTFVYIGWLFELEEEIGYKVKRFFLAPVIGPPLCLFLFVAVICAVIWFLPGEIVRVLKRKVVKDAK